MSTFTDNVRSLLAKNNTSINKMAKDVGIGGGTFRTWETENRIPTGDILSRIASYFDVSTDYLLGNEAKNETTINDDDIKFALFSRHDGITDEMFDEVRNFAKFVAEREREKKKNESK